MSRGTDKQTRSPSQRLPVLSVSLGIAGHLALALRLLFPLCAPEFATLSQHRSLLPGKGNISSRPCGCRLGKPYEAQEYQSACRSRVYAHAGVHTKQSGSERYGHPRHASACMQIGIEDLPFRSILPLLPTPLSSLQDR